MDGVSPCTHEEVDTRIVLHARDAAESGHSSILIKASDIDIVVICVSLFDEIGTEELYSYTWSIGHQKTSQFMKSSTL